MSDVETNYQGTIKFSPEVDVNPVDLVWNMHADSVVHGRVYFERHEGVLKYRVVISEAYKEAYELLGSLGGFCFLVEDETFVCASPSVVPIRAQTIEKISVVKNGRFHDDPHSYILVASIEI